MAGNSFGQFFRLTTFGESRSAGVGAVIDGCPAGLNLTKEKIQEFLNRRKPKLKGLVKNAEFSTQRKENDDCEILSGVFENKTLGSPIAVLVKNSETSNKHYKKLETVYRPGHSDYAYEIKYGFRDYRGGGRSSGRETIGRVIGGAIAKTLLDHYTEKNNLEKIETKIWAEEIAGIKTQVFENENFPNSVLQRLKDIKASGDSTGCILKCEILNTPEGLGSPVFDKLDAVLAHAIMSIGAVKGFQLGGGFNSATLLGSQNNKIDEPLSGGIAGGISACYGKFENTQKILSFSLAVKPPPSISALQKAYNASGEVVNLCVTGNHDVCLFPRIVSVIEAMVYVSLADALIAGLGDKI